MSGQDHSEKYSGNLKNKRKFPVLETIQEEDDTPNRSKEAKIEEIPSLAFKSTAIVSIDSLYHISPPATPSGYLSETDSEYLPEQADVVYLYIHPTDSHETCRVTKANHILCQSKVDGLKVVKLTKEEGRRMEFGTNSIIVLEPFNGKFSQDIGTAQQEEQKTQVFGIPAFLQLVNSGYLRKYKGSSPVFTLLLHDLHFFIPDTEEGGKEVAAQDRFTLSQMGANVTSVITNHTTHVVLSRQYITHDILKAHESKLVLVRREWIDIAWSSCMNNLPLPKTDDYRLGTLEGLSIGISSDVAESLACEFVHLNGGRIAHKKDVENMDIFVVGERTTDPRRLNYAIFNNIPVVNMAWLTACSQMCRLVSLEGFGYQRKHSLVMVGLKVNNFVEVVDLEATGKSDKKKAHKQRANVTKVMKPGGPFWHSMNR